MGTLISSNNPGSLKEITLRFEKYVIELNKDFSVLQNGWNPFESFDAVAIVIPAADLWQAIGPVVSIASSLDDRYPLNHSESIQYQTGLTQITANCFDAEIPNYCCKSADAAQVKVAP